MFLSVPINRFGRIVKAGGIRASLHRLRAEGGGGLSRVRGRSSGISGIQISRNPGVKVSRYPGSQVSWVFRFPRYPGFQNSSVSRSPGLQVSRFPGFPGIKGMPGGGGTFLHCLCHSRCLSFCPSTSFSRSLPRSPPPSLSPSRGGGGATCKRMAVLSWSSPITCRRALQSEKECEQEGGGERERERERETATEKEGLSQSVAVCEREGEK